MSLPQIPGAYLHWPVQHPVISSYIHFECHELMEVMFPLRNLFIFALLLSFVYGETSNNLTCYQCTRNTNSECDSQELLPCPPVSDRCVTHISKNAENGFSIKRECGLGPCGFDDAMAIKGLGFDHCDRSRDEYFCIFCCRENGCNKNESIIHVHSSVLLFSLFLCICVANKAII